MTTRRLPLVFVSLSVTVVLCEIPLRSVLAQQTSKSCPDWSNKFDQIQGSQMRQALQSQRAQGWSNVVAASGSPSQIFEQGNQIISMAQARIQSDLQGIQQIAAGNPAAVNDRVCQSAQGAVVALQCDIMASKDLILATQGTLEIAGCLTGFKGSINNGPPTTGFPVSGPNGSSGATTSDLLRSLLSGPSPSAPLASQSKYQEFEDAIANSKVAGDSAGREQEDANISASRLARQDGSNAGLSSEIDSALGSLRDRSSAKEPQIRGLRYIRRHDLFKCNGQR